MKERRTHVWIATVLSALVLAGLLLIFGLGLFEDNKPDTVTPTPAVTLTPTIPVAEGTPAVTPTDSVTPTDGAAPTESIPPTVSATPTPGGSDYSGAVNPRLDTAVYVLDVGEGSSALFCSGTSAVLIDGGDAATSSYVVGFLKSLGIRRLQLVVATHYDSDHISGLVGALSAFTVDRVWGPAYEGDTKTYNSFAAMIRKKEIPWELVSDGRDFSADGCTVTVLASSVPVPVRMEGTQESDGEGETGEDTSLALRVTLDNVSILVMGDSGAARERALVKKGAVGKFDIFLVNHHGSRYSNSAELLAAARPEYAVISVGENDYGHPTKECIDRLRESGAKIYRTDLQGMIAFTIEGGRILPGTLPLEDPYGTPEDNGQTRVEHPSDVSFILNGNSMVYHLPDCSSVAGVMRRNWFYFYGTAEEAEALGYRPCGSCLRH